MHARLHQQRLELRLRQLLGAAAAGRAAQAREVAEAQVEALNAALVRAELRSEELRKEHERRVESANEDERKMKKEMETLVSKFGLLMEPTRNLVPTQNYNNCKITLGCLFNFDICSDFSTFLYWKDELV